MASMDQLQEYENQLAEVETLLKSSPGDESLLSLKSDLTELLAITRQSVEGDNSKEEPNVFDKALQAAVGNSVDNDTTESKKRERPQEPSTEGEVSIREDTPSGKDADQNSKKKSKTVRDFEVPAHLIPRDNDTEAEKNRKRRAIKALKSKHREKKKEYESTKKQKSWQSFQKKTKRKDKSIFSTSVDGDTKVGVVTGKGRNK